MKSFERATRAQEDMWLAQKLQPNVRNNLVTCWDVRGPIDTSMLDEAHHTVLDECPDLQMSFVEASEGLALLRHDSTGLPSSHFDVTALNAPEKRAVNIVALAARDPFDLGKDRLYRMGSIRLAADRFFVFVIFHHIVTDAVGLLAYCHRVADVYSRLSAGEPVPSWPESAPGAIAQQERSYLESSRHDADLEFWKGYLGTDATAPVLISSTISNGLQRPTNPMVVVAEAVGMTSIAIDLSRSDVKNLDRAAALLQLTVPSLLIGAVAIAFRRMSASPQFTFAIAVANRRGKVRLAPGLAANAIPILAEVDAEQSLADVVKAIAGELPSLYRHSNAPIGEIRRHYFPARQDRSPVGPVLSFIPVVNKISFGGSPSSLYGGCFANLDELMISFYDNGDDSGLSVSFDAPADLYTLRELQSIAASLLNSIRELADTPDALVNAPRPMSPSTVSRPSTAASRLKSERLPYRCPRDKREKQLSQIFADALGVDDIGIDDDFFALGGNSLLAISLVAKLRKELGAEVAIRDLFQAPTIAKLIELGSAVSVSARPVLRRMT